MTTLRTHQCNFCRATIKDSDGIGLAWLGDKLDSRPMASVEDHLCGPCARALAVLLGYLFRNKEAA